jgi:Uncharacterised nucleotidyltransferase
MSEQLQQSGLRLIVERASADAVQALQRKSIRTVLIRGPLQQKWLEHAGPPRASRDVDLLVARDDLERAEEALSTLGLFRSSALPADPGFEHAHDLVAPGRVPVELHWSIVGTDESHVWEVLAQETEPATICGNPVEIPNEAARCLIVALHAAQHGIGDAAIFGDLEKALVTADNDRWLRALELARAVGAETPFVAALSLTTRGETLLEAFQVETPPLSDRQALSLITPAPSARGFYSLSTQSGARAKGAFLASKLVPPPTFMRLRYPIAQRGLVGLTLAYLYRPLWLIRWVVPGFRSWMQARRLANKAR